MTGIAEYGLMLLGALFGAALGWLLAKNKYGAATMRAQARAEALEERKASMLAEMESVASNVARQNSEDFLRLAEERARIRK